MKLTAIVEREGLGYVSLCPELDIASRGDTIEHARDNLQEALALFFECASPHEVRSRLRSEVFITQVEVAVGQTVRSLRQGTLRDADSACLQRGQAAPRYVDLGGR